MGLYKLLPVLLLFCSISLTAQITEPPKDTLKIDDKIFTRVEVEAAFPGGDPAWRSFLVKNLNRDVPSDNGAPNGRYTVIVKFTVSKDGTLKDIHAETKLGYGMEQEVIRIIRSSGVWLPAIQDKRPVNAFRRQPVTFMLEEDGFEIRTTPAYTLYTGDNPLNVDIRRVKNSNIRLTISDGTISTTEDGQFIAHVAQPGRVLIKAFNIKTGKELGAVSFEVRKKG